MPGSYDSSFGRRDSRGRGSPRREDRRRDDRDRGHGQSSGGFQSGGFGGGFGGGSKGMGKGGDRMGGLGANLERIRWDDHKLSTFTKDFYHEHPHVAARSPAEVDAIRTEHQLQIVSTGRQGDICPKPVANFQEASFPEYINASIAQAGFEKPSAIQAQGWPIALSGRDMIGIAETGSGKTLAFLLPGVVHINAQEHLRPGDGPIALVLAPTRELAMQIGVECNKFCASSGIKTVCVYGGQGTKRQQCMELRQGREVIVATPGRLIDLLEMGVTNLKRVTYLCLDEADRMLDMGFEDQVRKICSQIRPDRQTLLWSATWPKSIQHLATDLCRERPVHIHVGSQDLKANPKIAQYVEVLQGAEYQVQETKHQRLVQLMKQLHNGQKIIIFSGTKKGCEVLTRDLRRERIAALAIHGDKEQHERDHVLKEFREGRQPVLVATDVAARGLDVKDVKVVINYDMPNSIEDYVHRIGRTGRAGATGAAYTFFTTQNGRMARDLIDILTKAGQAVPNELHNMSGGSYGGKGYGKGGGRGGGGGGKGYGKGSYGRY